MKKFVLSVSFMAVSFLAFAQENEPKKIELTTQERQLVENNNDFAFNLFRKARGVSNSIMSPLSITYALGLMNNGAAGQTQKEINDVLGFGEAGADGINAFCRKMLTEAPTLDNTTAAEIANTVYVNSGQNCILQQGFIDKANQYYDAEPQSINFYEKQDAMGIINGWANDRTHGMIPMLFDEETFNVDAVSYLLNALYFKGAWTYKFDKQNTREEPFNGGETVPMMQQSGVEYESTWNSLYQAIHLPYGNGAYKMTIFLPQEGKSIDDVLSQLNGNNWNFKGWKNEIDLKLPRIKTDTFLPLVEIMKELGMITAFTPWAEFPYFCNSDVYISNMFQKAAIELDEEGTEAAAVTVIEVEKTAITPCFYADRPFIYIISEQSTGTIFFIGQFTGKEMPSVITFPSVQKNLSNDDAIYDLSGRLFNSQLPKRIYIQNGRKVMK